MKFLCTYVTKLTSPSILIADMGRAGVNIKDKGGDDNGEGRGTGEGGGDMSDTEEWIDSFR